MQNLAKKHPPYDGALKRYPIRIYMTQKMINSISQEAAVNKAGGLSDVVISAVDQYLTPK
jgi:hypothetical protein